MIEVFGEEPFSPETKKEALHYDKKQQQLCVYEMSQAGQITNKYIKGEERSFIDHRLSGTGDWSAVRGDF